MKTKNEHNLYLQMLFTIYKVVQIMGRDEHNRSTAGKSYLAQTPKNMKTDETSVELAEAFVDVNDKKAFKRREAVEKRLKEK